MWIPAQYIMKMVFLTALGVGGATIFGSLIGFLFKHISHRFSDIVLSFAAGVMLSAAVLGLILPSLGYSGRFGLPITIAGIFAGAFLIFFAYIGFDALATAAEECKNPQKDLPIGIIGSLIITTIVYVSVALVLTGLQDTSSAVPLAFLKAPMAYCMSMLKMTWAAGLISIGSLAGLTSVLLVL